MLTCLKSFAKVPRAPLTRTTRDLTSRVTERNGVYELMENCGMYVAKWLPTGLGNGEVLFCDDGLHCRSFPA